MIRTRQAFSLLELVLAIGLSIALVALLGMAINLHLVRLDSSQSTIEQAQLARAVLDRITSDLRGATMAPTQDVSELLAAAESAAQFNVDEVDEANGDEETTGNGSGTDPPPGVNGTFETLRVDLRGVSQSLSIPSDGTAPVARIDAVWSQVEYGMSLNSAVPGLVRTVTARDHARWREEQGQAAPFVDPIAGEVLSVRFAYYDGQQLLEVWDMGEQEALPVAVEVTIEVVAADPDDPTVPLERRTPRVYRRFVQLTESMGDSPSVGEATATDSGAI